MRRISITAVALGAVSLASLASISANAADAAWYGPRVVPSRIVATSYTYEPAFGGPYYPYEWSYGFRVGYGYPYGARYIQPYPFAFDFPARYAEPHNYRAAYAWAGPPCYVSWTPVAGGWRKARICD